MERERGAGGRGRERLLSRALIFPLPAVTALFMKNDVFLFLLQCRKRLFQSVGLSKITAQRGTVASRPHNRWWMAL